VKKLLCLCMIVVLALSLSACGAEKKTVHYENDAWEITLPEGWMSMQDESFEEFVNAIDADKRQSLGLTDEYIQMLRDAGVITFYGPTLSANFYVASDSADGITPEVIDGDLDLIIEQYSQMGATGFKKTGEVTFGKNKAMGLTFDLVTLHVEQYYFLHDGEIYIFNFTAIDHGTVKDILSTLVFR